MTDSRRDAARVELQSRWESGEGAAHTHAAVWDTGFDAAIGHRDWDAAASFFAPAFVGQDHRLVSWGTLHGPAGFLVAVQALVYLVFRAFYLQRLFEGFAFLRHAARAFLPTVPAAAVVLLLRGVEPGHRTLAIALGELAIYALVTVAATWYFESRLLREALGYVLRRNEGARPAGFEPATSASGGQRSIH